MKLGTLLDPASAFAVAALALVGLVKTHALQSVVPVDLTLLSAALCLVLSVAVVVRRRGVPVEVWLVCLFLVALVPGMVVGHFGGNSYARTKDVYLFTLVPACLVAPILLLATERARRWFLGFVVAVAVIPAVIVLTERIDPAYGRATVGSTDPISTGRVLAAAAVVVAVLTLRVAQLRVRIACAAGSLLLLYGVWRTGSRGPLLAAVLAVAVVAGVQLLRGAGRRTILLCAGAATILVAGVVALVADGRLVSRDTGASDSSRLHLLGRAAELTATHPLGIGWGRLIDHLSITETNTQGVKQYPHNMLLEVGSEGGWIALAALLALIVVSFRRVLARADTLTGAALLGLWVLALAVAMTSSDFPSNRLTLVMLGVGLLPNPARERHPAGSTGGTLARART